MLLYIVKESDEGRCLYNLALLYLTFWIIGPVELIVRCAVVAWDRGLKFVPRECKNVFLALCRDFWYVSVFHITGKNLWQRDTDRQRDSFYGASNVR